MHRSVAMLALAIGTASLTGCAHSGARSAMARAAAVSPAAPPHVVSREETAGAAPPLGAYTSPVRIVAGPMTGTLFLRAVPGASGTSQLRVTIAHSGYWVNFGRSVDLEGRSHPVTQLGEHVSCDHGDCTYYEEIAVSLPETDLAKAAHEGLVLQISGQRNSYVAELPAAYVADFVRGLAEREASRTNGAADRPVPAAPAP
jgi:hypothetical protein